MILLSLIAGIRGLRGIIYDILHLARDIYVDNSVTGQGLQKRFYVMENHLMDIPTKSIPHMSPDGASSDGSLELKGATSYEVDDLYKRLFTIIGFPGKAVYFNHASFSDMERPVVLPLCQYLEHMENVCKELMEFLSAPDCALKKSRKRQSENILQDHYQSDKIIHDLRPRRNSSSEKPVTFKSEVASATRKHSPSQTLEKGTSLKLIFGNIAALSDYSRTPMARTDGLFTTAVLNSFLSPLEKSHSCKFGII